MSLSVCHDDV